LVKWRGLTKEMLKFLRKDEFLKNNIILFFGSAIVAVLNYLYHPILSRIMTVKNFGEVQTLVSIFLQTGVVLGVFGTVVTNLVANNYSKESYSLINQLYKIALGVNVFLSLGIIIGAPILKSFLHFQSIFPFWVLAISLPFGVPLVFRRFFYRGRKGLSYHP